VDFIKRFNKKSSYLGKEKYKFDKHNDNTYYLAGNFDELSSRNKDKGKQLFKSLIKSGPKIYKDYLPSDNECFRLLSWIRDENSQIREIIPENWIPKHRTLKP